MASCIADDGRHLAREPISTAAAPVPDLYEVFSTPYTTEDVARGVRAKQSIGRGELVEVAHCIRIPKDEYEGHLRDGGMLSALGVGSHSNHSQQPNLNYTIDLDQLVIECRAARAIAASEELTITYGSSSKLWFEDRSVDSLESSRIMSTRMRNLDFLEAFRLTTAPGEGFRVHSWYA